MSRTRKKPTSSAPTCIFCKKSSYVQFVMFNPRFRPFGTACDGCEKTVTPQQIIEAAPLLEQSATRDGLHNCAEINAARAALTAIPQP